MSRFAIALILVGACGAPTQPGGGDDVPPPGDDPTVQLGQITCMVLSGDTVSLDIDASVTLAEGMAVDATISVPQPPGGSSVSRFFACGSWDPIQGQTDIEGCHRSDAVQGATQQITITYTEQVTNGVPSPVTVDVSVNARSAPFSQTTLASDATSVPCGAP